MLCIFYVQPWILIILAYHPGLFTLSHRQVFMGTRLFKCSRLLRWHKIKLVRWMRFFLNGLNSSLLFLHKANHRLESLNLFDIPLTCLFVLGYLIFLFFAHFWAFFCLLDNFEVLLVQVLVAFFHELKLEIFLFMEMEGGGRLGFFNLSALLH